MTLNSNPIIHEKFTKQGLVLFNFALLRLPRPVEFSLFGHIQPVCLPASARVSHTGREAVTAGFGHKTLDRFEGTESRRKGFSRDFANHLQKLRVKIVDSRSCEDTWTQLIGSFRADPDNLCALDETGDICEGDKGSGLVVADCQTDTAELVGVASFTFGCLSSVKGDRVPIVYGKITSILEWIEEKTSDVSTCRTPSRRAPTPPLTRGRTQCDICGINYPETSRRVIGGRDATPGEYPWAALILIDNKFR